LVIFLVARGDQPQGTADSSAASITHEERTMTAVHVLAIITALPGRRAEILDAFKANVANVHAEDGCIEYVATVDAQGAGAIQTPLGEDSFVVVEKWASLDALKAHAAAPHMAEYAAMTRDKIASRVIHVLSPI
jgi:quinol monooxygenase YgiN